MSSCTCISRNEACDDEVLRLCQSDTLFAMLDTKTGAPTKPESGRLLIQRKIHHHSRDAFGTTVYTYAYCVQDVEGKQHNYRPARLRGCIHVVSGVIRSVYTANTVLPSSGGSSRKVVAVELDFPLIAACTNSKLSHMLTSVPCDTFNVFHDICTRALHEARERAPHDWTMWRVMQTRIKSRTPPIAAPTSITQAIRA